VAQTNTSRGRLTVYQHDIELIERFARENPDIIAKARQKLRSAPSCTGARIFISTSPESGWERHSPARCAGA
jgi:hypothetical protein